MGELMKKAGFVVIKKKNPPCKRDRVFPPLGSCGQKLFANIARSSDFVREAPNTNFT